MASAATDGESLLCRLRLLGFEEFRVAGARRRAGRAGTVRVAAWACHHGELAWRLFGGTLKQLELAPLPERLPAYSPVVAA